MCRCISLVFLVKLGINLLSLHLTIYYIVQRYALNDIVPCYYLNEMFDFLSFSCYTSRLDHKSVNITDLCVCITDIAIEDVRFNYSLISVLFLRREHIAQVLSMDSRSIIVLSIGISSYFCVIVRSIVSYRETQ